MPSQKISKKNPPGQPTKFNPERCARIIDAVSKYAPYSIACEANGIHRDTLYEWLKIARDHKAKDIESDYTRFSDALKEVEMKKILQLCSNVEAGVDRWQSNAWLLERRWREHFGADAGIIQDLQNMFNELKAKFDAQSK